MKKHYRQENNCLNCGAELQGKYCHVCGQENLEIKESFGHMMNHAVSDYFHFDHQFFHTIKPLLFKPGYLTNEYMAGKRAQFLHPVKMYIFISVVYFLLMAQSGAKLVSNANNNANPVYTQKALDSLKKELAAEPDLTPKQRTAIQKQINNFTINVVRTKGKTTEKHIVSVTGDTTIKQYHESQGKLPMDQRDGWFDRKMSEKLLSYQEKYGDKWQEEFSKEIEHNLPKMMFVLLPLFAFILGTAFRKSKKYYVEHLIFSLHVHCFFFLFFGIVMIFEMILPGSWHINNWISLLAAIYMLWYFYKALKVVYHRTRFRTITKLIGITLTYLFAYMVCFCLLLVITAMTT